MTNLMRFARAVLATTILFGVGCTSEVEELATDDLDSEIASEADLKDLSQELEPSLIGCTAGQIDRAQNACRNTWCGSRGSYGIHYCAQRPAQARVYAQCDCRSGADPTIWWPL